MVVYASPSADHGRHEEGTVSGKTAFPPPPGRRRIAQAPASLASGAVMREAGCTQAGVTAPRICPAARFTGRVSRSERWLRAEGASHSWAPPGAPCFWEGEQRTWFSNRRRMGMFWDPSEGEQAQRRVSGGRGSRVSGRLQLLQGSPGFFGGQGSRIL